MLKGVKDWLQDEIVKHGYDLRGHLDSTSLMMLALAILLQEKRECEDSPSDP